MQWNTLEKWDKTLRQFSLLFLVCLFMHVHICSNIFKQAHIHIYMYIQNFCLPSWRLDVTTKLFRWLFRHRPYDTWKMFQCIIGMLFLSHVLLLPYLHLALSKLDVLGTKPVSPRVRHRVICKNYENIERQNTDDGTLLDI